MQEKQLENDALVAFISAPDATVKDYIQSGVTAENTQLLDPESYKELPGVKKLFTKDDVFDDQAFQKVYDAASKKYFELTDEEAFKNMLEYNPLSRYKPLDGKEIDTDFTPGSGNNPERKNKSIVGLNVEGPEIYTEKELAQMGKIWDSEKGEWIKGETAESRSLGKKILGESLVYAKYTEDGMQLNPITGQQEYHKAGDWMRDEDGNYFTMTAGEDDLGKKEVVAISDILTKEDSWLNEINVFDSDERDKSIPGIVMKTAFMALPYLIPGVNTYYGALTALGGFTSVLPTFYKSLERTLLGESNSGLSKEATALENWFRKFEVGRTDHAKENFFSLEGLGSMLADTFGQLHQQRAAASLAKYFYKIPGADELDKLNGLEWQKIRPLVEKQNKLGKSLSLGYMGLVSAADTYNDAINAGYDHRTAGLVSLATAASLFGIMNFNETANGLGTWFLKSTTGYNHDVTRKPVIQYAKKMYEKAREATNAAIKDHQYTPMNKFMGDFWANAKSWMQDTFIASGEGIWKNAIVEGVEEVSEEVIQDMVKGVADLMSSLGFTAKEGSFGGWSNVFSAEGAKRYFETLVGGAFGGALFSVQQNTIEPALIRRFKDPNYKTDEERMAEKDILDLLLRGRGKELTDELQNLKKIFNTRKGAVGFTDEHGDVHDFRANGQKSQADMIVDGLIGKVQAMETAIKGMTGVNSLGELNDISRGFLKAQFQDDNIEEIFSQVYEDQLASAYDSYSSWQTAKNAEKTLAENEKTEKSKKSEDSSEKKESSESKSDKEETKKTVGITVDQYKKEFDKQLDSLRNFFNGKEAAQRSVQASLIHRKMLPRLVGLTDIKTWYNLNYKTPTFTKEFDDLEEGTENDLETTVTKASVKKAFENYKQSFRTASDLNDVKSIAKVLPRLTKLYLNASNLMGPDAEALADLVHKKELLKTFNEYESDKIYEDFTDDLALEDLFTDAEQKDLEQLSADAKEKAIKDRKQLKIQQYASAASKAAHKFRNAALSKLIAKNPYAFGNKTRINFDLAGILVKKGVIDLSMLNEQQATVYKALINQVAQDSGLVVFNEATLRELQKSINDTFSHSENLFTRRMQELSIREDSEHTLIDVTSIIPSAWDFDLLTSEAHQLKMSFEKAQKDMELKTDPEIDALTRNDISASYVIPVSDGSISDAKMDKINDIIKKIFDGANDLTLPADDIKNKKYADLTTIERRERLRSAIISINSILKSVKDREVTLARVKSIVDLVGTDTVIDTEFYEQLQIAFAAEVGPVLTESVKQFNLLTPNPNDRINFGDRAIMLEHLAKIDLTTLKDIDEPKDIITAGNLLILFELTEAEIKKLTSDPSIIQRTNDSGKVLARYFDFAQNFKKEIGEATRAIKTLEFKIESLKVQINTETDPVKKSSLEADLTSRNLELNQNQEKLREAKKREIATNLINGLYDIVTTYAKTVEGKKIEKLNNPLDKMLRKFYIGINNGSTVGIHVLDYILDATKDIQASDVTGDTLFISEDTRIGIRNALRTIDFVNVVLQGMTSWGGKSGVKNVNEVYRDYLKLYGSSAEKSTHVAVIDAEDGVAIGNYLTELNVKLTRLAQIYDELNKGKSKTYAEFAEQHVKNYTQFLQKHPLKIHFEDLGDKDLLEGITDDLKDSEANAETLLKLRELIATNLHTIYKELSDRHGEDAAQKLTNEIVDSLMKIKINGDEDLDPAAALFQPVYSWQAFSFDGTGNLQNVSVAFLAQDLVQLAVGSPKEELDLLKEVYNANEEISPRIDQEQALINLDFAIRNPKIVNALQNSLRKVAKDNNITDWKGDPYANVYTLFGTGGAGKTLLIYLLSQKYKDSKTVVVSATLQEKVDDLIKLTEKSGTTREGKTLSEWIPKLKAEEETFKTQLSGAIKHIREYVKDNFSDFQTDPTKANESAYSLEYVENSEDKYVFKAKSGDIEFKFTIQIAKGGKSISLFNIDVDSESVSKLIESTFSTTLPDNSVLVIDECTQLSPLTWRILESYAKKHNSVVIAMGDPMQKEWSFNEDTNSHSLDIQHYALFNAGNLYGAWRADNSALRDLVDSLYTVLYNSELFAKGFGVAELNVDAVENLAQELSDRVPITYTLDSKDPNYKFLGTYMTTDSDAIKNTVAIMDSVASDQKVIIVGDNVDKDAIKTEISSEHPELSSWTILTVSEAQGKEFDYTVLYKLEKSDNFISNTKTVFTALTRAKKGQLVIQVDKESAKTSKDLFTSLLLGRSVPSENIVLLQSEARDNIARQRAQDINILADMATSISSTVSSMPSAAPSGKVPTPSTPDPDTDPDPAEVTETEGFSGFSASMDTKDHSQADKSAHRGKEAADSWRKAGFTDASGVGSWYTRLGIDDTFLFEGGDYLKLDGQIKYNYTLKDTSGSEYKLDNYYTIDRLLTLFKDHCDEEADFYAFLNLIKNKNKLVQKSGSINEVVLKFLGENNLQADNNKKYQIPQLINLFEQFKYILIANRNKFTDIFAGAFTINKHRDYAFRKFNDDVNQQPSQRLGVVLSSSDNINFYFTLGALNYNPEDNNTPSGYASDTQSEMWKSVNPQYSDCIYHKNQGNVNSSKNYFKALLNNLKHTSNNVKVTSNTDSEGFYQAGSGIGMRFNREFNKSNNRYGDTNYNRMSFKDLLDNGFEVLNQRQINTEFKDYSNFFQNGIYTPNATLSESDKKVAFIKLINGFRWTNIDPSKQGALENFYDSCWVLMRKKGSETPILVRVSKISSEFKLTDSDYAESHTLKKYKHRSMLRALIFYAGEDSDLLKQLKELPKESDLIKSDYLIKNDGSNAAEIIKKLGTDWKGKDNIYDENALKKLETFKQNLLTKLKDLNDPNVTAILSEVEKIIDSYTAKLKFNACWTAWGDHLKSGSYTTPSIADIKNHIIAYKDVIISNNSKAKVSEKQIQQVITFFNTNMSKFFYENGRILDNIADLKNPDFITDYVAEAPPMLVDWTVWQKADTSTGVSTPSTSASNINDRSVAENMLKNMFTSILQNGQVGIKSITDAELQSIVDNVIAVYLDNETDPEQIKNKLNAFWLDFPKLLKALLPSDDFEELDTNSNVYKVTHFNIKNTMKRIKMADATFNDTFFQYLWKIIKKENEALFKAECQKFVDILNNIIDEFENDSDVRDFLATQLYVYSINKVDC